jgi:L-asparaginase
MVTVGANRTVKISSLSLNAFDSPNFPPLATHGAYIHDNKEVTLPQPRGPFRVHKTLDSKVALFSLYSTMLRVSLTSTLKILVLKLVPGFDDESIHALVQHGSAVKGIVLELYGTGNGPANDKGSLMSAIKLAKSKGIVCVAVSQCLTGGVSLDTVTALMAYCICRSPHSTKCSIQWGETSS